MFPMTLATSSCRSAGAETMTAPAASSPMMTVRLSVLWAHRPPRRAACASAKIC